MTSRPCFRRFVHVLRRTHAREPASPAWTRPQQSLLSATLAAATLAAASLAALPAAGAAQSFWVGGRAGTLGLGADLSLAATDWLVFRGSAGLLPLDAEVQRADHRTMVLELPRALYTIGADLEIGNFRIGGGMLYKQEDPLYAVTLGEGARLELGEGAYAPPELTRLTTTLTSEPWAPYALLGFGQHNAGGLGLFLDVGVVFLDGPDLSMSAEGDGDVLRSRAFQADLEAERHRVRGELGDLVSYWPILNLGVRYGFGGDRRDRWTRPGRGSRR